MRIHLPAATGGVVGGVTVCVELCKEFLNAHNAQHEHPGLVSVIARTPVTFLKGSGDGKLGDLFPVAENAEFCLAA